MKTDLPYLLHIRDAIGRIEDYGRCGKESFCTTPHWQDAIIRQLEIIGEATKRLSSEVREDHPEIPWRRLAGLRDVLIHDYMSVDLEAVWAIVQDGVPALKACVERILAGLN